MEAGGSRGPVAPWPRGPAEGGYNEDGSKESENKPGLV